CPLIGRLLPAGAVNQRPGVSGVAQRAMATSPGSLDPGGIRPFLVRAAQVARTHGDAPDAVLVEEAADFLLDGGVFEDTAVDPAAGDGVVVGVGEDAADGLGGGPVMGAVAGQGRQRVLRGVVPAAIVGDSCLPLLQVLSRDEVLVLLGDQQAGLLEGVDEGGVEAAAPHGLGQLMFDLFGGGGVEEEQV